MDTSISITIDGKTPLLCNRFTDAAQIAASENTSASIVGSNGTPKEIAESKLYVGYDGETLIIPGPNMFRAIIDAGKFFKAGKSKVTTQKSSIIPSCLELEEVEIPIQYEEPWTIDMRPIRNPSTGGRRLCYRPCFHDWKLSFALNLDSSVMSAKFLREILDKCGSAIGLGDFRPDCKGPFGKFWVTRWVANKMSGTPAPEVEVTV